MVTPRITRKFLIAMKIQNILENYGLYNALLAVCILGSICLDTFIAWRGYMFNATSEDDQYSTLIYFFGLVGYFMVCAVLGDIFFDRPHNRPAMGIFDGLVISILHFFLLFCYFFYWVSLPADVWNPCQYYMPDFYWVSFRITPLLLFCQTVLSGSCAFVIYRKRQSLPERYCV